MKENFDNLIKQKTTGDLNQILLESSQYQPEMVKAVEVELAQRGEPIDHFLKRRQKENLVEEQSLETGKKGSPVRMSFCALSLIVPTVLVFPAGTNVYIKFLVIALIINACVLAFNFGFAKTPSESGKRFYTYNKQARMFGRGFFFLSLVFLVISIVLAYNLVSNRG
jgi:flagellar biosynthesis protein FliP